MRAPRHIAGEYKYRVRFDVPSFELVLQTVRFGSSSPYPLDLVPTLDFLGKSGGTTVSSMACIDAASVGSAGVQV